jgi:DNA-directed RNA polymerase specialized sigma24 family protein
LSNINTEPTSFTNLLTFFDSDLDEAANKYIRIQECLIKKFEQRGCRDPYELAVETLSRVEAKLGAGVKIEKNITAMIHAFAKNVLREYWDDPSLKEDQIEEGYEFHHEDHSQAATEEKLDLEARIQCMAGCLSEQPPETRSLFLDYNDDSRGKLKEVRKALADRLGIPLNTLRQRILRLNRDLGECIEKCLKLNDGKG